jgi:hypothetical protein
MNASSPYVSSLGNVSVTSENVSQREYIFSIGKEIRVNTATQGDQNGAKITTLSNGNFIVTWNDHSQGVGGASGDFSGWAVKAQVFAADGRRIGQEISVNTATQGDQYDPQITPLPNGGFVITWNDAQGRMNRGDYEVRAQVFAADGTSVGAEIHANTAMRNDQKNPQVAALPNSSFVITWQDNSAGTGRGSDIKAQLFATNGSKSGDEIFVNIVSSGIQHNPQVTGLSNGSFIITWQDGSRAEVIKAQLFAANGRKIGDEFLVNTATTDKQSNPLIAELSNGGFVIVWEDKSKGVGGASGDADGLAIKAQVFAADGSKVEDEILVNTAARGDQSNPQIAVLPNGGFVITWQDGSAGVAGATGDNSGLAVKAQIFAANGIKIGDEILVNTTTQGDQWEPQITALPNNGFIITWTDENWGVGGQGLDSSLFAVKAQVFASDGSKIGDEILVNTAAQGNQHKPQITTLPDGKFAITWVDMSQGIGGASGDFTGAAVKAQVFGIGSNGTAHVDTAHYGGNYADYSLQKTAAGFQVAGPGGVNNTLHDIERIQFFDRRIAIDLDDGQAANSTVRLIGAALGASTIQERPGYVGIGLNLFDDGLSMLDVSRLVIDAIGNPSSGALVNLLYQNILGAAPSAAEHEYFLGLMEGHGGSLTQAQLLDFAASTSLNATNIDLVGLQQSGVEFLMG